MNTNPPMFRFSVTRISSMSHFVTILCLMDFISMKHKSLTKGSPTFSTKFYFSLDIWGQLMTFPWYYPVWFVAICDWSLLLYCTYCVLITNYPRWPNSHILIYTLCVSNLSTVCLRQYFIILHHLLWLKQFIISHITASAQGKYFVLSILLQRTGCQ